MSSAGVTSSGGARLTDWPAAKSSFSVVLFQLHVFWVWDAKVVQFCKKFVERFTDTNLPKLGFCFFSLALCRWLTFFVGNSFTFVPDAIWCNEAASAYISFAGISSGNRARLKLLTVMSLLRGRLFNQTLLWSHVYVVYCWGGTIDVSRVSMVWTKKKSL